MEGSHSPIEVKHLNTKDIFFSKIPRNEIAGLLNWPEILSEERANRFKEFIDYIHLFLYEANITNDSSGCWSLLAMKNCNQLLEHGYNNFKRTIGHNYFNFLVQKGDPQITAVERLLPHYIVEQCYQSALLIPYDPTFTTQDQFSYKYFIFLLWEYVKQIDKENYLSRLEEPNEGNPILVHADGKNMSQDLANSLIEYYSIREEVDFQNIHRVLEIGGGYGRNAHVILTLNPHIKMVMVDIFPALYISQQYLSSIFKNKKIFKAKHFSDFGQVEEELTEADIIFLLPNQLDMIPDQFFDLSFNISSFGEMTIKQIEKYFHQLNRLTRQYFYMKQWNISKNPFDNIELNKNDYPYPKNWQQIYLRDCVIQNAFFETLFKTDKV